MHFRGFPENKAHGANMGPTWVLLAPDGPHVGPMKLAIRVVSISISDLWIHCKTYAFQTALLYRLPWALRRHGTLLSYLICGRVSRNEPTQWKYGDRYKIPSCIDPIKGIYGQLVLFFHFSIIFSYDYFVSHCHMRTYQINRWLKHGWSITTYRVCAIKSLFHALVTN